MSKRQIFQISFLIIALLVLLLTDGLWLSLGLRLKAIDPPTHLLGGFPLKALGALAITLLAGTFLTLVGLLVSSPDASPRRPTGTHLALGFLTGGALAGIFTGWLGFLKVGGGMIVPTLLLSVSLFIFLRGKKGTIFKGKLCRPAIEWVPIAIFLFFAGLAALAPAIQSDGLRYHLTTAQEWGRAGAFTHLPYNANSNLPSMQSLLSVSIAGVHFLGRTYQIFHFLHLIALTILTGELARCVWRAMASTVLLRGTRPKHPPVASSVAFLVVGCPVATILAGWPFSDVAATAYLIAGIWVLAPGVVRSPQRRALLTSLLLGAAVATKISLLPLVGMVGLWAMARELPKAYRNNLTSFAKILGFLIIPGALVLGPWIVKNIVYHQNPVYPIAYSVFGGDEWNDHNDAFYKDRLASKGLGHELNDLALSPLDMTINWPAFESFNPGPALLGLLLVAVLGPVWYLIATKGRRSLSLPVFLLFFLLIGWGVWFKSYQSVRFFLPQLMIILVLGTACLYRLSWGLSGKVAITLRVIIAGTALMGALWTPIYHTRTSHVYGASLGLVGDDVYINRNFDSHDVFTAITWLNKNTSNNEPVMYIGEHRAFYAENYRPVASDWFDTPRVLVEIQETPDNEDMCSCWVKKGYRYVLFNLGELSMYEQMAFRPRFTDKEWARYQELKDYLLSRIVFDSGKGAFVCDLEK